MYMIYYGCLIVYKCVNVIVFKCVQKVYKIYLFENPGLSVTM